MAKIFITAQNFDIYDGDGLDAHARTGSTSIEQLYRAGACGVIIGHSESNDPPEIVRKKVLSILKKRSTTSSDFMSKITLLVGESWNEFNGHSFDSVAATVCDRLKDILRDLKFSEVKDFVIGYEPKWGSRGSGNDAAPPPSPALVSTVGTKIHSTLVRLFGKENNMPLIYGGRSDPERTREILHDENIEGLILGSACNSISKTMMIVDAMNQARPNRRKILHANFKAFNLLSSYDDYLSELEKLDDSFVVYVSPCHVDVRELCRIHRALKPPALINSLA